MTDDLKSAFEEAPESDDLFWSMEWEDDPEMPEWSSMYSPTERAIHARTGTKVDIYEREEGGETVYSVQPKMGGYDDDAVVQPDDPGTVVSGPSSVVAHNEPDLPTARMVAFIWLRGWMERNSNIGDIRDLEADE